MRLKEEETRQELDAEIAKLRDETNRIKRDARDMASKYDLEMSKLEAQIRESAERAATQQAQMKKEYEGELEKLKQQVLQDAGNTKDILDLRHKVLQLETQMANMPRPRPESWHCTIM